jgi:uncharacterized OB-fold protein
MTSIVDLSEDPPKLRGGSCRECGFVFFPFQAYGCEKCGAYGESLRPIPLKGQGRVTATTVVHRHADPRRPPPFHVVQLVLDEGPSIRGIAADDYTPEVGERVGPITLPDVTDDELLAVRFAPEKETAR